MTVVDTTILELLGKQVSFSVLLDDELKYLFPDPIYVTGEVEAVLIHLSGHHKIMVCDNLYLLSEIDLLV